MALASISLRGLRNLDPTTIDFDRGTNYLFGPNGAGKTNLLEAIHYLAIGRSFRRCPDAELLGFDKDVFVVSGVDESDERAEIRFDGREKRVLRNDIPVQKLSEYFGWLPVVVLLLEDIELVRGAPTIRRSFLDMAVAKAEGGSAERPKSDVRSQMSEVRCGGAERQGEDGRNAEGRRQSKEGRSEEAESHDKDTKAQSPRVSYITQTVEYRRAVSQYNRLLERGGERREQGGDELAAWEEELVRTGVPVYEARLARTGGLLENAARHYERLTGQEAVYSYRSSIAGEGTRSEFPERNEALHAPKVISVMSPFDLAEAFRQRLAQTRERARAFGHALVGPHRDDIRITRSGRELRKFGSVGEQRLAGIALRLAEADMLLGARRQRPVFLLDEVASELDEQRSRMALEMVAERGQMVYAAARRLRSEDTGILGFKDSSDGGGQLTSRDSPALDPSNPRILDSLPSGKEFHVEAGTVSEVP